VSVARASNAAAAPMNDVEGRGRTLDYVARAGLIPIPDEVAAVEASLGKPLDPLDERGQKYAEQARTLKAVRYEQLVALRRFINEVSPFATKHGVKGAEFENVLVVVGRGWNQYDFGAMLEMAGSMRPSDKLEAFERSRNLFYVAISRPKTRLAILFTQLLTPGALRTVQDWFGAENIRSALD
jgi:DNA helicase-2/ATP-dependent DNA helicase PcrA